MCENGSGHEGDSNGNGNSNVDHVDPDITDLATDYENNPLSDENVTEWTPGGKETGHA